MKQNNLFRAAAPRFACLVLLALLAACGTRPSAQPGTGGYYKVGKPYQIKGQWYYPEENYSYDETGIASWYGDDFHRQATANGEIYNKGELTAAHRTLPLPSLARVTNLDNGRAIVVRVNDRGPFARGRIIDVSQRAAQLLGFEQQGTAKVRVQVLADESRAIAEAMRRYGAEPREIATNAVGQAQPQPTFIAQTNIETRPLPAPPMQPQTSQPPLTIANVKPVAEYTQVPVVGNTNIFVQAGAFTRLDNATKLKNKLSSVGRANVVEAVVKGVQYYRVRIGPIATVAEADKMLKRVMTSGAAEARIIVD